MPLLLSDLIDWLRAPAPDPDRVAFLKQKPYAHRGLHGGGRVENSISAFRAAIEQGYGIELDVRMSLDAQVIVFHDDTLDRLTRETGPVHRRSRRELCQIKFSDSNEAIPGLDDVVSMVAGRGPILVEIKADGPNIGKFCLRVRRALEGYRGQVAVMSFNPEVVRWFRRHAKSLPRGLVITEGQNVDVAAQLKARFARHAMLWRAKPDFIAYDIRNLPSRFAAAQRKRGLPVLTWTVRSADEEARAAEHADEIIFEHPAP